MYTNYNVIPRYTPGSPAWVDASTGRLVAKQEEDAIGRYLEGFHGPDKQALAEREGLEGIVLVQDREAHQDGYRDVITGRYYGSMPYMAIRYPERLTLNHEGRQLVCYFHR